MTLGRGRPTGASGRRRAWRVAAVLLAVEVWALAALVLAPAASAHASLIGTLPADGTVLPSSPSSVGLRFDEAVEVSVGSVRVLAADGSRVDAGRVRHSGGESASLEVPLRGGLVPGTYLVDWRVVSADAHSVHGSFTFSVGVKGAVADVTADAGGSGVTSWLLGLLRFLVFGGIAVLVGTLGFVVLCWPAGWSRRPVRRLVWASLATGTAATVLGLLAQGSAWAGSGLGELLDPTVLQSLPSTRLGAASGARVMLLLAVAVVLRLGLEDARRIPRHIGDPLGVVLAAVLVTVAVPGHAGASTVPWLTVPLDVVHLAASSLWVGALPVLALLLRRGEDHRAATDAVARFSRLALWCVAAVVASGLAQAYRQVGALGALTATTYGRLLVTKVATLAVVVALALLSRRWVRARAAVPAPGASSDLAGLRRTVGGELVLGAGVVAVTAALVAVPPARVDYRPTVERTLRSGSANGSAGQAVGPVQPVVPSTAPSDSSSPSRR